MKNKEGKYEYDHPRNLIAVDGVIISLIDNDLKVLVINQGNNLWSLPGHIVRVNEDENGDQWCRKDGTQASSPTIETASTTDLPSDAISIASDGYTNLDTLKQQLLDGIKMKVEIDYTTLPDLFTIKKGADITQLEIRDKPDRDADRTIIRPGSKKKDWVVSIPFMMLMNKNFVQVNGTAQPSKILSQDIVLKNKFGDNGEYRISRWASLYKILKDNTTPDGQKTLYDLSMEVCEPGSKEHRETVWRENGESRTYNMLFDHAFIVLNALLALRRESKLRPVGRDFFLTEDGHYRFTIQQLHSMYEIITNHPLEISNLKKTLTRDRNLIQPCVDENGQPLKTSNAITRPSILFEFNPDYYTYYSTNYNLCLRL